MITIKLVDARKGLHSKCVELFKDLKIAESIYRYLCDGIEECEYAEPEPEPLTDEEQRIFLSAIGKEKTLCQNIEKLWDDLHLSSDDDIDLVKVCDEIERKVKKALWA